jgi:hypothetical protein
LCQLEQAEKNLLASDSILLSVLPLEHGSDHYSIDCELTAALVCVGRDTTMGGHTGVDERESVGLVEPSQHQHASPS